MIIMLKYTKKNRKCKQDTKQTNTENKSGNFWGGSSVTVSSVRSTIVMTEIKNYKEGKNKLLSNITDKMQMYW